VNAGQTPAEVSAPRRGFPEMFASQYATGEIAGSSMIHCAACASIMKRRVRANCNAVAQWTPPPVYLVVVLLIAYKIFTFTWLLRPDRDAGGW